MKNVLMCFLCAFLVIAADVLIKRASTQYSWRYVFQSSTMLWAYIMYLVQIVLTVFLFKKTSELAIYTNLFVVFYSIFGVLSGIYLFNENLQTTQWVGIVLALISAILLNSH